MFARQGSTQASYYHVNMWYVIVNPESTPARRVERRRHFSNISLTFLSLSFPRPGERTSNRSSVSSIPDSPPVIPRGIVLERVSQNFMANERERERDPNMVPFFLDA